MTGLIKIQFALSKCTKDPRQPLESAFYKSEKKRGFGFGCVKWWWGEGLRCHWPFDAEGGKSLLKHVLLNCSMQLQSFSYRVIQKRNQCNNYFNTTLKCWRLINEWIRNVSDVVIYLWGQLLTYWQDELLRDSDNLLLELKLFTSNIYINFPTFVLNLSWYLKRAFNQG